MPLNPNGKIDKPALPFPDTAEAVTADVPHGIDHASPTEKHVQAIWSGILTSAPQPISLDESFFDLGGHSILATRLIFELRKAFVVEAPLSLVFDHPTIREQAAELDALRNSDLGLVYQAQGPVPAPAPLAAQKPAAPGIEYSKDFEALLPQLKASYEPPALSLAKEAITVFLTGATGFLGAFILRDLLSRQQVARVICHVRAASPEKALDRLREGATDRGVWDESWLGAKKLEVVAGDLAKDKFGLEDVAWERIANEADVIVHNGALVRSLARFPSSSVLMYVFGSIGPLGVSV